MYEPVDVKVEVLVRGPKHRVDLGPRERRFGDHVEATIVTCKFDVEGREYTDVFRVPYDWDRMVRKALDWSSEVRCPPPAERRARLANQGNKSDQDAAHLAWKANSPA